MSHKEACHGPTFKLMPIYRPHASTPLDRSRLELGAVNVLQGEQAEGDT